MPLYLQITCLISSWQCPHNAPLPFAQNRLFNCFLLDNSFSSSSVSFGHCLVIRVTPFATSSFVISSFYFRIVQTVDDELLCNLARSAIHRPHSLFHVIFSSIKIVSSLLVALSLAAILLTDIVGYNISSRKLQKNTEKLKWTQRCFWYEWT